MDATQSLEWHAAPDIGTGGPGGRPGHGDAAGVDAGGTLVKIAYDKDGTRGLRKFRSDRLEEAAEWLRTELPGAPLCLTGGKGAKLAALTRREAELIPEFEATCAGIRLLLPPAIRGSAFLLANVGTGTSVHVIDGERHLRVGGTGLGGGTIVGLARLLTGLDEYEAIVGAAAKGDRDTADLKVRHIYEGLEPPIDGDLTASNFGRVLPGAVIGDGETGSISREDALASVIGMVGEAVATLCVSAAAAHGVKTVVYIGSSFNGNAPLRQAIESYTRFRGGEPHFVENGEFSGALGALMRLGRR
jgi:Pantothenate kinase, acetyl-CoA regulated